MRRIVEEEPTSAEKASGVGGGGGVGGGSGSGAGGKGKRETFHESSVTGVQVLVRG